MFAPGCLERTVTIDSDPPGAIATMSDHEVGRTPATTSFTFYGDYDVSLRRDGYEPIVEHRYMNTPIYECPPFDLVAIILPFTIHTRREMSFKMNPDFQLDEAGEAALRDRAKEMQAKIPP